MGEKSLNPDPEKIARQYLSEQLAALDSAAAASAEAVAVAEAKPSVPVDAEAYVEKIDAERKPVSPFGHDPKAVGSAEREMRANNRAAAKASSNEVKNDVEGKNSSLELAEQQRVVFEALGKQKEEWLTRLVAVRNKKEFEAIKSEAAKNGKYRAVPSFVVDKPLRRLLKERSIVDDVAIQPIKDRAFALQAELAAVYLAKEAEIYPAKTDDAEKLAPVVAGAVSPKPADVLPVPPAAVKPVVQTAPTPTQAPAVAVPPAPSVVTADAVPEVEGKKVAQERERGEFYVGDLWVRGENDESDREVLRITHVDKTTVVPFADIEISTPGKPEKATRAGSFSLARLQDMLTAGNYQAKEGSELAQFLGGVKSDSKAVSPENLAAATLSAASAGVETAPKNPEEAIDVPVQPEAGTELTGLDAEIAKLTAEVADTRAAFIAVEESQQSAWKNLTRIFHSLSRKSGDDGEVMKYQAWYDEKITALKNAKLEKLKQSGLGMKELRPAMAVLIREFEFDEAERIYDTRQEMRLSKSNQPLLEKMKTLWNETTPESSASFAETNRSFLKLMVGTAAIAGEAADRTIEKVGTAYLKLSKGKAGKYLLGATVAGGGAVALGLATGGVGSAAVGLLALKRLVAGAGVAVTIEGLSDKVARSMREKKRNNVEADHKALFDAMEHDELAEMLGEKENIKFARLEAYLKQVSAKARQGEGARRKGDAYRKSVAIFAGAVLGSGVVTQYIGTRAHAASMLDGTSVDRSSEQIAAALQGKEDAAIDAVAGGPGVEGAGSATAVAESSLKTAAVTAEKSAGLTEKAAGFLSTHEVKSGENVWKLAEKAVADTSGMDHRSSERFAKLVELKLQAKLDASPELARAAGFVADADGKFSPHSIQAGAKLEIGKLLSTEEMTALIEEAKSNVPIEAAVSGPSPDTPIRTTVIDIAPKADPIATIETSDAAQSAIPPAATREEKEAIKALFDFTPEQELTRPDGNVMKYVESLPRDEQEKLFRNFKKLSVELFQTDELMKSETYDVRYDPVIHPELSKAKLTEVLSDHKLLSKNPLASYDRGKNPLHWSQMEEAVKFTKASAKAFGAEFTRAKSGESIQEYALRMAALAGSKGKKIPGFRMLD